jgi:hypothetical protein
MDSIRAKAKVAITLCCEGGCREGGGGPRSEGLPQDVMIALTRDLAERDCDGDQRIIERSRDPAFF